MSSSLHDNIGAGRDGCWDARTGFGAGAGISMMLLSTGCPKLYTPMTEIAAAEPLRLWLTCVLKASVALIDSFREIGTLRAELLVCKKEIAEQ